MSLTLITGPMFSGKTSLLLSYINKFVISKKHVLCVNHSFDKRYDENGYIHSHNGQNIKNSIRYEDFVKQISSNKIEEIITYLTEHEADEYHAIFIDEGHFFEDIHMVENLIEAGFKVFISFLNSDYKMESFKVMDSLYAKADKIHHLCAVCNKCGDDAPFTTRLVKNEEQVLVGSLETYEPRCRTCLLEN